MVEHSTEDVFFERIENIEQPNKKLSDAEIIAKFTLNAKQEEAFRYIADVFHEKRAPQLRMFVTGAGGTGKTQVLNAMKFLFQQHGRVDEMRCGSYMVYAASNIGGSTLHELFDL